jgi:hypothetical protein
VVKRPQEKHGIDTRVGQSEGAGIADLSTREGWSQLDTCLFNVKRDRIDQVDLVSAFSQPDGISPWPTAYVCHDGGWRREVPLEKHLSAHELKRARSVGESMAFEPPSIIRCKLVIA